LLEPARGLRLVSLDQHESNVNGMRVGSPEMVSVREC
jgi:hypothetical protein